MIRPQYRYLRALAPLVILCWPFTVLAQEFSTPESFVKSLLRGEDILSLEAKGDLNDDGLADWAGVIRRDKPDFGSTHQLYILLRTPRAGYRIAQTTREEQIPGMGCCWVEDLRIERGSIYIQNNAKTAVEMEAATHQFKFYQGEWRLLGIKIYEMNHRTKVSTETDMNLLTGLVIEKKQKGNRKPVIKRSTRRFSRSFLRDFDFFNGFGVS